MKQLTIKELSAYLPYGLKMKVMDTSFYKYDIMTLCDKGGLSNIGISNVIDEHQDFKPILYDLSYLTNFLEEIYKDFKFSNVEIHQRKFGTWVTYQLMGETFKDLVYSQGSFDCCPIYVYNELVERKLDVFSLIPDGLAVAVTEDFNPYIK